MLNKKKIIFVSGTRADFGKIKSLITILEANAHQFEVHIFVTGMHLQQEYGYTYIEIKRCGFKHIHTFENTTNETTMDLTLAKTITGFSEVVKHINPNLIVVHGDRVEALAGAIVGSLNNILVAHIEGGELSGTIDELIRHSVSKLSHIHFVANPEAERRLLQMGELQQTIFEIGSPDVDVMQSKNLPILQKVKAYYEIPFESYAVAMFHPVTTEYENIPYQIQQFILALEESNKNYVVIYPNNDLGSSIIIDHYNKNTNKQLRILPSLRFEYFLTLLKNAEFIVGNSSAGVREAPYFNIPTINIGTRQNNRVSTSSILNCEYAKNNILDAIKKVSLLPIKATNTSFGKGNSDLLFLKHLRNDDLWNINHQKQFRDMKY